MNPYSDKPPHSFWKRAIAAPHCDDIDLVDEVPFVISQTDKIATAGSCFAQHIARTLVHEKFGYLITESGPVEENYGIFPARFGNIYTTLQLLQLFERAYGLFEPDDKVWLQKEAFVDPFRPQVATFDSVEALNQDRVKHLAAVRRMFEDSDVLLFTLGLTETWMAAADQAAVPLAPGVAGTRSEKEYCYANRSVADMVADMTQFIEKLRVINPGVRIILTVSPVPLIATFEDKNVLVANSYSKAALRVVAEMVTATMPETAYFPSYEIITGHHTGYRYFDSDLRSVRPEGVDRVMSLFTKHYLSGESIARSGPTPPREVAAMAAPLQSQTEVDALYQVMCEEEAIDE